MERYQRLDTEKAVGARNIQAFNSRMKEAVTNMKNTKFVVKVNRGGTDFTEYVERIDRTPIQTTPNPKLALRMGRFTAEDAVKSIQNSRCISWLESVQVIA